MPPQTHPAPPRPPPSPPPLFNSVHQHFLLQPVSVTLHFLSGLNQSNSPQSARFWVSLKRQRASKSITAFLIFIDPKTRLPLSLSARTPLPPTFSLRGINYSKEGDCAVVFESGVVWLISPATHLTRCPKNVQPSAPQRIHEQPERARPIKNIIGFMVCKFIE